MDAREARERLEMVDDILKQREREQGWSCRELGVSLMGIGLGAGILNVGFQFGSLGGQSMRIWR